MAAVRVLGACVTVLLLALVVRADDKPNYAKLMIGKWEVSKADDGTVPKGTIIEFTKDGKLKGTVKQDDQEMKFEGTYKVDGDKFTVTVKLGDDEHTNMITITKIDAKEMATKDSDGKTVLFTRQK